MKRSSSSTSAAAGAAGAAGSSGDINKIRKTLVDEFNAQAKYKKILKLTNMETNKEYAVTGCRRVTTMFDPRIALDLGEVLVFFPERFTSMSDEAVQELNIDKGFVLIKDDNKKYTIKFKN